MGNRRSKSICPVCDKVFLNKMALSRHVVEKGHRNLKVSESKYVNKSTEVAKTEKSNG